MLEGNKLSFLIAWDLKKKKQYLRQVLNIFSYHSFAVSPTATPGPSIAHSQDYLPRYQCNATWAVIRVCETARKRMLLLKHCDHAEFYSQ